MNKYNFTYRRNIPIAWTLGFLTFILLLADLNDGVIAQAIEIDSANSTALTILYPGHDGISISDANSNGITISGTVGDGIEVTDAEGDGIFVNFPDLNGVYVSHAGSNGISLSNITSNGMLVQQAGGYGVRIEDSGLDGFSVNHTGDDGLHVVDADDDGVFINHADGDGLHVANAGQFGLRILGEKNVSNQISGHLALLHNQSNGSGLDVLALQVETLNPGGGANFITFYDGGNSILGQVQGNGSGGISYESTGADYAEYLPAIEAGDEFQAGDIVGVHEGKISHRIEGAQKVMVITEHAAVVGNQPQDPRGYEKVSFMGVPVRVQGPVAAGAWIVADGGEKGVAIAVSSEHLSTKHRIVGQAWESSADPGIKRINTAVGLSNGEEILLDLRQQISVLLGQMRELNEIVTELRQPASDSNQDRQ